MKRNVLVVGVVALVLVAALVAVAAVAIPKVSAASLGAPSAATTPGTTPVPGKASTTAYLGISVVNITTRVADQFKLTQTEGVAIASVVSGSPAATAGLQAGDVVNKVNGVAVKTASEVVTEVQKATAGDVVTLDITRADKQMTVKVTSTQTTLPQSRRGLRGDDSQPKVTPTPGTGQATPTTPKRGYQNLPTELQGLLNLSFDSIYGSTQTFKDANGNVVTVYWIPGTVSAISATSITITPNNPQGRGGPFTIDDTTLIRVGKGVTDTTGIAVNDKVTIVVVGNSNHASIVMSGGTIHGMGGMGGFDMPYGGRGFDFRMPFGRGGGQNQQQKPTTPGSGA